MNNIENQKPGRRQIIIGLLIGIIAGTGVGVVIDNIAAGIGMGLAIGAGVSTNRLSKKPPMRLRREDLIRIFIGLALYMISIFGGMAWRDAAGSQTTQLLAASLPLLPGLFFIFAIGKAISNLDEMQRRIQTEALAVAFAGTFLVTQSYGFMEEAGAPQLSWIFVPLIMVFFWVISKLWIMRKY